MKLIDAVKAGNIKSLVEHATGFTYKPRKGMLEASNNALRLDDCTAWSYSWWCYYKIVDGKGVFNAHSYSKSTAKHQSHMRRLLRTLGLPIDIEIDTAKSISPFDAEDVRNVLLKNFYRAKAALAKCKRASAKRDRLESDLACIAGYVESLDGAPFDGGLKQVTVVERNASLWGSGDIGVHRLDPDERDLADALETAERDGFPTVYVYRTRKASTPKLRVVGGAK